jgi:tetratricopeptide (TPR) repeat protein
MRGELQEAERLADAARDLGEQAGEPDTLLINLVLVCLLRREQGRGAEVVEILELGTVQYPGIPGFEAGLSAVLCEVGRGSEAATKLDAAVDRGFAGITRNQGYSTALSVWAKVAADTGSERAAAPLYDLILPWRDLVVWNGSTGYGAAEMYLGLLAATLRSHDRALEHFTAASRQHRDEGIDGWEAENLCGWAACLLDLGDPDGAILKATEARNLAGRTGQAFIASKADALLQVGSGR